MQMSRRSSSSAEEVAGSTDTLSEVLLRLPAKSLIRFKCVCKWWLTLISDPRFCHSHSLHSIHHPSALLLSDNCGPSPTLYLLPLTPSSQVRPLNLDFLNQPQPSIIRSCNGLLLCHVTNPSTYFICNPTTRNSLPLTLPFTHKPHSLYLAFDPATSPHFQLLSIQILHSHNDQHVPYVFHVYSSNTRSWTHTHPFKGSLIVPPKVIDASGVYCNRAVHWCNYFGEISLYFDVHNLCLKNWKMPLSGSEWSYRRVDSFGQCGGRLHLIIGNTKQPLQFDVYEVEEDYSVWSLKHCVDLSPLRVEFPELRWDWANLALPFYIAKEENSMLVLLLGGVVISYSPVNGASRKLCDFKPGMTGVDMVAWFLLGEVFQYFENLSFVETFAQQC